jgi:hypothetical protein
MAAASKAIRCVRSVGARFDFKKVQSYSMWFLILYIRYTMLMNINFTFPAKL